MSLERGPSQTWPTFTTAPTLSRNLGAGRGRSAACTEAPDLAQQCPIPKHLLDRINQCIIPLLTLRAFLTSAAERRLWILCVFSAFGSLTSLPARYCVFNLIPPRHI